MLLTVSMCASVKGGIAYELSALILRSKLCKQNKHFKHFRHKHLHSGLRVREAARTRERSERVSVATVRGLRKMASSRWGDPKGQLLSGYIALIRPKVFFAGK